MGERSLWQIFRDFLFSKANREFLIFLFFLMLSSIFWLFAALTDTYEKEINVPITITNVPKNVVLTSPETDTVRVTIRDRGINIAAYLYGDVLKYVKADFKSYARNDGTGSISASELQKLVYQQLGSGAKITAIKPDKLEFFYNYGAKKRVPVRWTGRVIPEQLYFISRVQYWPDSVDVYAPQDKLDSIRVIYTEPMNYANFRDTLMIHARLQREKAVKTVPDEVRVGFFTDVLTEESIDGIPIKSINTPKGKVVRTFPSRVKVFFVTGVNVYRNLKPEDFVVTVDYDELVTHPSEKCHITLKKSPAGISRVHLEVEEVDYLIENVNE